MSTAPMSVEHPHDAFVAWSISQGVVIDGIAATPLPGRGTGMIASKDLEKYQTVVFVPTSCLLTIFDEEVQRLGLPKDASVLGKLAAFLTTNHEAGDEKLELWRSAWPAPASLDHSLPVLWKEETADLLPPVAKKRLQEMKSKIQKDLKDYSPYLPAGCDRLFTHYWLIVNSRCAHWDYPDVSSKLLPKPRKRLAGDDCMCLFPFADFFNHSAAGCLVSISKLGYRIACDRPYKKGEELCITYGPHCNDLLLVEYGFILPENPFDYTSLDKYIMPSLSDRDKAYLESVGYLGNYSVFRSDEAGVLPTVCYRTEVALRCLILNTDELQSFIDGTREGDIEEDRVREKLVKVVTAFKSDCKAMVERIKGLPDVQNNVREILLARWKQLQQIAEST